MCQACAQACDGERGRAGCAKTHVLWVGKKSACLNIAGCKFARSMGLTRFHQEPSRDGKPCACKQTKNHENAKSVSGQKFVAGWEPIQMET